MALRNTMKTTWHSRDRLRFCFARVLCPEVVRDRGMARETPVEATQAKPQEFPPKHLA